MQIKKVGVVGCGLMGHGIVQVAAQGGCEVIALESEQAFLDKGLARVDRSLAKLASKNVEKGKMDQAAADAWV
ncbi:MAG: 3-hydroxyacyl-CoA dehydrogenase NAD-binding domain-containing protein, partial [Planctomycetota bacterium]